MKEKTIKDIVETTRNNWSEEGIKSQDEPCYQGKFWDHTKKDFVSWSELIKKDNV